MSNPRPHKNFIRSLLPSPSPPSQGATGENDWFAISHGIECSHTEDSDPLESFGQVAPVQPAHSEKIQRPKTVGHAYPRIHFESDTLSSSSSFSFLFDATTTRIYVTFVVDTDGRTDGEVLLLTLRLFFLRAERSTSARRYSCMIQLVLTPLGGFPA